MGIPVLILGESGSGKSSSMRNFNENEVGVFNVASKPFPFRKNLNKVDNATYDLIKRTICKAKRKKYVIDDSQYLMAFALFGRAKETGYTKFSEMAFDFYDLIKTIIEKTPPDVIVYLLHHVTKTEFGVKAKTVGKMLDDQLTVEGLFSVVLLAESENGEYHFLTKTRGNDTVKTPIGMFETQTIDNDLKLVDETIRNYWELNKTEE